MKSNLTKYQHFLFEGKTGETYHDFQKRRNEKLLNEEKYLLSFLITEEYRKYIDRYNTQVMFESEKLITEGFDKNIQTQAIKDIENRNFIKNNYKSYVEQYMTGKNRENLTPYEEDALEKGNYNTYQVPNISAGFFIRADGYAGGLYNNSGIPNIGDKLIPVMMELGKFMDHFDGPLSYLYDRYNIPVINHAIWDDEEAPFGWKYKPLDARNIHFFYGKQFQKYKEGDILPQELIDALNRYNQGKPDIIFRGEGTDIR